jgi:glycosyltransferase involved in cell wall biosynthesis
MTRPEFPVAAPEGRPFEATLSHARLAELYDPTFVRHVAPTGGAPVQVCVDGRMLAAVAGTGVATYAEVLARCLPEAGAAPAVLDQGPAARTRLQRWMAALGRRTRLARDWEGGWAADDLFKEAQVFFNLHGRLLPVVCEQPPQVMHWTYPVPLYMVGSRNLYTVHDLIPLTQPRLTQISRRRHEQLLSRIVEHADRLVTVSDAARADILARFGHGEDFVVNTYQAVHAPLQRDHALPDGLRAGRYFFFCGTVEPRKNLAALVKAHARAGVEEPLVIAGPSAGHADLEALLARAPNVVRLDWLPRPVLIGVMRRARALLFPSLAEGFGLPIAEAMTLGCPVLTSDRGAPGEIAGGAALTVDPSNIDAMSNAIARLTSDDKLCAQLRAAGFQRARLFSPHAYARRLRALYSETLSRPARQRRLVTHEL